MMGSLSTTPDRAVLWDQAQQALRKELSEQQFRVYVESAHVAPLDESGLDLLLMVPNQEVAAWFHNGVSRRIEQLVGRQLHPGKLVVEVSFQPDLFLTDSSLTLDVPREARPRPAPSTVPANRKAPSRNGLAELYTFENYYSGSSNEVALTAGMKLAIDPGASRTTSPLFIHGSVGLGKSHLAHAVGNRFMERNPDASLRLLSGEQFMREVQQAFLQDKIQKFRGDFRMLDMLIIDDIQMIGRDSEQTHKQFLGLFNYMDERELPIVLTSDRPAARLTREMPQRILSRISMGVDVTVGVPDLDTRIGILTYQARSLFGITLTSDTAHLVASHLRNNCRELVGALRRMALQAEIDKTPITTEIARQVLREMSTAPKDLTVHEIIEHIAKHYKLKTADLVAKKRTQALVHARHVAMYMCRELTQASLPSIGEAFGCHHSSVIHACKKISALLHKDSDFNYEVTLMRQELVV